MMRYIKSLENKDLSLNTSMISLGQLYHETECSYRNDSGELACIGARYILLHLQIKAKGYQQIIDRTGEISM